MSAKRHSLGGSFQDDPRSAPSFDLSEDAQHASEHCAPTAFRLTLARLIPAGPATALAMPPTVHRRAV
jgi:hypothetical protein